MHNIHKHASLSVKMLNVKRNFVIYDRSAFEGIQKENR